MGLKKVATVSELPRGKRKQVTVDGKVLALFNIDGKFYCIDGKCTHKGGPLGEGEVEGTIVTCPWHGSKFEITTGEVRGSPANKKVSTYNVKVSGKDILVDI